MSSGAPASNEVGGEDQPERLFSDLCLCAHIQIFKTSFQQGETLEHSYCGSTLGQLSHRRQGMDSKQYEENPGEAGFSLLEP